ncbi:MAG: C39 family peptidase [Clostridia bacterium]|nr:C39 family peptidase [Clostridia bacterium]
MKKIVLDIPHVQQPANSAMCGAACLEMMYRHFGLQRTMRDVWPVIKKESSIGRINCRTALMAKEAAAQGFTANVVISTDAIAMIESCLEQNIGIIYLCRKHPLDKEGHFSAVVGRTYKGIHINDPRLDAARGANRPVKEADFLTSLRPFGEVTSGNTFLLLAPTGTETEQIELKHQLLPEPCCRSYEAISAVKPYVLHYLCHDHDLWFDAL